MKGLIVKGIGGFYYIETAAGLIEAQGRGIFRKQGLTLCVGDEVEVSVLSAEEKKGVIEAVLPRRNHFIRPPIANVDMLIVTFAAKSPKPNFPLIDKLLIWAQAQGLEPLICINKCDLVSAAAVSALAAIYEGAYPVVTASSKTGAGLEKLKAHISGKKAALAGPSGAGKSSLLNALHPPAEMETGQISQKTQRGRHTTRHVEIFAVEGGGRLFDTPGFTSLELPEEIDERELRHYYPEFDAPARDCRYDDCQHLKEPDCAVRAAALAGTISPQRYQSYIYLYEGLKDKRKY